MPLPKITHLQFAVLRELSRTKPHYSSSLQLCLNDVRQIKIGPSAFYQLMGRLEDAGLITRHGVVWTPGHYTYTAAASSYLLTRQGQLAMQAVKDFYSF